MFSYRKTKDGTFVVYGPASALVHAKQNGVSVSVSTKAGKTKTEMIDRVGRAFDVAGVSMAYGYMAERVSSASGGGRSRRFECDECDDGQDPACCICGGEMYRARYG